MNNPENQASHILEAYGNTPLLQAGELRAAAQIPRPERITQQMFSMWHTVAAGICERQQFQAVAFTEFEPDLQKALGFGYDLPPHVIYYAPRSLERGAILVNTSIIGISQETVPRFEGCGSIARGEVQYFRRRPVEVTLHAYMWQPDHNLAWYKITERNPHDAVGLHEYEHVAKGQTSLDYPEDFVDIRDRDQWREIRKTFPLYSSKRLRRELKKSSPRGILTYDKPTKQFILVDVRDSHIERFA